jgi:hypothetical protein
MDSDDELKAAASRRTKFALAAEQDLRDAAGDLRACRAAEAKCGDDPLYRDVAKSVRQRAAAIGDAIDESCIAAGRTLPELLPLAQAAQRLAALAG